MRSQWVARGHGAFNIATGLWPLVSMRTFEAVLGPKTDEWLVKAVGGLLISTGLVQLGAAGTPEGRRQARRIGMAAAGTLALVDAVYVPKRRISPMYVLDAALHLTWIGLWARTEP